MALTMASNLRWSRMVSATEGSSAVQGGSTMNQSVSRTQRPSRAAQPISRSA